VKILTVVGNRPQFIKAAAVSGPLREQHEEVLVHTGQHHDDSLSRVFFSELGLARPDRELGISGGTNTSQTERMLEALEPLLEELAPDAVLVYGDTNSTLAGATAAARGRIALVHVEAGMRSFDWSMPEELNRVLTDHLGDLLLCPSDTAAQNLESEGVRGRVDVVGDVMVDVAIRRQPSARTDTQTLSAHGLMPGSYLLLTAHRAGNVDDLARLEALVELVKALPMPVLFAVHPRTRARLKDAGLLGELEQLEGLELTGPLGYMEFSALACQARAIVTDSGGVQKEAYLAGVPCVTLRANTEWVETVQAGWNTLVDLDIPAALAALESVPPSEHPALYGDGHAAERCVQAIGAFAETAGARR
jgi:UDP-N-acetylglucosamine 2-epimerase (non-hydrolysing)/UDP-GlcNAc3NAcA epimerase